MSTTQLADLALSCQERFLAISVIAVAGEGGVPHFADGFVEQALLASAGGSSSQDRT